MERAIALIDAAVRLGVSRERVLRLITSGQLRGFKNQWGRWEVAAESLEGMVASSFESKGGGFVQCD